MHACIKKFIAVTVVLLATACSSSPTKVLSTLLVTEAAVDTPTPPATATQTPSKTPSPTTSPTKTNTLVPSTTPTAAPDPMLSQIEVIGLSWFENYDLLLSFQFPGEVNPDDYRVTLEDKEYTCEVIDNYADRLYCRGQGAKVLAEAWVRVYPIGSREAGFEKAVWIPYFDNNYDSYYSTNP